MSEMFANLHTTSEKLDASKLIASVGSVALDFNHPGLNHVALVR